MIVPILKTDQQCIDEAEVKAHRLAQTQSGSPIVIKSLTAMAFFILPNLVLLTMASFMTSQQTIGKRNAAMGAGIASITRHWP